MTTSSLVPEIRSNAARHRPAHQLLVSTSYLQGCGRRVFVAHQQKRSLFQEHCPSSVGDLVYKNRYKYHYFSTYVMVSVTSVFIAVNLALLLSGYRTAVIDYDEATVNTFLSLALVFSTVLYLLSHVLMSRTIFYIYYNESTRRFLGITYNWHLARKNLVFKPGDVKLVEDNSRFMRFMRGSYRIDNHPYHISGRDFVTARHYNLMLGFIDT